MGVSLIIPALVRPLSALFSPVLRLLFGVEGKMAATNATRNRGRTALTASALMVGISLVVAFSALGGSVLGSIRTYLEGSLGSDFVVQPANSDFDVTFSGELEEEVSRVPGVAETTGIATTIRRDGREVNVVLGVDESYPEIFRLNLDGGAGVFDALEEGEALVGQQLAERRNLGPGDEVELRGIRGTQSYRVAGVVENDILDGGTGVYVSKETMARDFGVDSDGFLAIKAEPGGDREEIGREVGAVLRDYPQLSLYSNA